MKTSTALKPHGLRLLFLILSGLFSSQHTFAVNTPRQLSFTLPNAAVTSAGIFKKDGTLIRTLWSNVSYQAGNFTANWDGLDDEGVRVKDTGLIFRVLSGNVRYTWEGTIGNNSDSLTGSSKIRSFERINSISIGAGFAYYGTGYSEGIPSSYKFDLTKPHNKINILDAKKGDIDQVCLYVCTDGIRSYWAGFDAYSSGVSFIYATKNSNDSEYLFNTGTDLSMTYGRTYRSVIDRFDNNKDAVSTGLCVQKKGRLLIAAHGKIDLINIFDKSSGELLNVLSLFKPSELSIDEHGNLWYIEDGKSIKSLQLDQNGVIIKQGLNLNQLSEPLSLAVTSKGDKLYVIEGGMLQQIRVYRCKDGSLIQSIGQKGGYYDDPEVTDDKFYFSDSSTGLSKTYIGLSEDGSYWFGDVGNERLIHHDSTGRMIDFIMSLPHSYSTVTDKNNPSRVFNQYLEFESDIRQLPKSNNWKLKRNWRRYIPYNYHQQDMIGVFRQLTSLSNGSAYAILDRYDNGIRKPEIVELPAKGRLRFTGIVLSDFARDIITESGTLRRIVCNRNIGDSGYFEEQKLLGFDAQRNPIWGNAVKTAYIPEISAIDPAFSNIGSAMVSSSGYHIVFNAEKENKGYHLGAIARDKKQWLWKTSRATGSDYTGPMPKDGSFDIGNGVVYPGGDVFANGSNILWNYHGEFWKNSQTNIWNHYHECGLMVSQFGVISPEASAGNPEAFAMGAGNVFSSSLIPYNGDLYIFHNDESVHGAVHRWRISELNSIKITDYPIDSKTDELPLKGLKGEFYKSRDLDPVFLNLENICLKPGQLNIRDYSSEDYQSVRWSGTINSKETFRFCIISKGPFRVFMADTLLIEKQNGKDSFFSPLIQVGSDRRFKIEAGKEALKLLLDKSGLEAIPEDFFSADQFLLEESVDLLYGLRRNNLSEKNYYGWYGDLNADNELFRSVCGKKSIAPANDIAFSFFSDTEKKTVYRNLKGLNPCSEWSVSGTLNFEGNFPDYTDNRMMISLKDSNGKTLVVIENSFINLEEYAYPTKISCNGEDIINQPYSLMYSYLNQSQKFELKRKGDHFIFTFGNLLPLMVTKKDQDADPNAPGAIEFSWTGGQMNSRKQLSVGELKFKGNSKLRLQCLSKDSLCPSEALVLQSPYSDKYLWNNGSSKKLIEIFDTSSLWLRAASGSCKMQSEVIKPYRRNAPLADITRNADTLKTSFTNGSWAWLYQGRIKALNSSILRVDSPGMYTLTVADPFGCTAKSEYDYRGTDLNKESSVAGFSIFPNPASGYIEIRIPEDETAEYELYDDHGRLIDRINLIEKQTLVKLKTSGTFIVKVSSKSGFFFQKLINIPH